MFRKSKMCGLNYHRRRLVVLGAAGVGKSSILSRFLYDEFQPEYTPTVEDFHQIELLINGRVLPLDIVDTTGYYSFPAMKEQAILSADAFVLVFKIGDEDSFKQISAMRDLIWSARDDAANIPIVVVGNMIDLKDRGSVERTTTDFVITMDWNHAYVETSAKNNYNIRSVFDELLEQFKLNGISESGPLMKSVNSAQKREMQKSVRNKCTIS